MQPGRHVRAERGVIKDQDRKLGDISIDCHQSNDTTWQMVHMNLTICGIDDQMAHKGRYRKGCFPDLKADDMFVNQPFNVSEWRWDLLDEDKR
jgi:hypothetical protein